MKKFCLFLSLACAMLFVGCSSDDDALEENNEIENQVTDQEITISAGIPEEATRAEYDGEKTIRWSEGDKLTLVAFNANNALMGTRDFELVEGAGNKSAKFTGRIIKNAAKYVFYYNTPNLKIDENGKATMNYEGQTQTQPSLTSHLKDYIYLQSEELTESEITSGFTFKIRNSFFVFHVSSIPAELGSFNEMEWINNAGTDNEVVTSLKYTGSYREGISFYVSFDPEAMKLEAGKNIAVRFYNGTVAYEVKAVSANGKAYQAGGKYNAEISTRAKENTLHDWSVYVPTPADNEVFVKTKGNVKPDLNGFKVIGEKANRCGYWTLNQKDEAVIKNITKYSFNNASIIEIVLPSKVEELESFAFHGAKNLVKLVMPNSLRKIGSRAFSSTMSLKVIELPEGVTDIDYNAFTSCWAEEIVLPSTVSTIKDGIFYGDYNLKKLTVKSAPAVANFSAKWIGRAMAGVDLVLNEDWNNSVEFAPNGNDWYNTTWKSITLKKF